MKFEYLPRPFTPEVGVEKEIAEINAKNEERLRMLGGGVV